MGVNDKNLATDQLHDPLFVAEVGSVCGNGEEVGTKAEDKVFADFGVAEIFGESEQIIGKLKLSQVSQAKAERMEGAIGAFKNLGAGIGLYPQQKNVTTSFSLA